MSDEIDWAVEFAKVSERLEKNRRDLEEQHRRLSAENVHHRQELAAQARARALNSIRELQERQEAPSAWKRFWGWFQFAHPGKAYVFMVQVAFGRKVNGEKEEDDDQRL